MSEPTTIEHKSPVGKRQTALRANVYLDVVPIAASNDYASADLKTARADAAWGDPIPVVARDTLELLLTFTKVAGQTGLIIAVQASPYNAEDGTEWFDRYTTFEVLHGDAVAIPTTARDLTLDVSGFANGEHRVLTEIRTIGHYMRFKPYGAGTVTASRCKIEVLRHMEGS